MSQILRSQPAAGNETVVGKGYAARPIAFLLSRRMKVLSAAWIVLFALSITPVAAQDQYAERSAVLPAPLRTLAAPLRPTYSPLEHNLNKLNRVISVRLEHVKLGDALQVVATKADLQLARAAWEVLSEHTVTLDVANVPALEVFHELIRGTDLRLKISPTGHLIVTQKQGAPSHILREPASAAPATYAHVVSGVVTSADDRTALPGVNIVVKHTMIGTTTDAEGRYTLEAPAPTDTLVFSYLGFQTQEIPIAGRASIDVPMVEQIYSGGDVLVVGYGEQEELTVTGAVSSVGDDEVYALPVGDAASRLQGRVAGVTVTNSHSPSGGAVVRVRGIGSINDNNPLYVVDGVPMSDLGAISPSEIESMTVLKDASSSAIYGSRAANGVIVVTTKRGNRSERPLNVSLSVRSGFQQPTNALELLNTRELGEKKWQERINDGYTVGGPGWGDPQYGDGPTPTIPDYTFPAGAMEGEVDESLYAHPNPYYGITRANKEGTDWQDEIFGTGWIQEYNLGVSGRGERNNFAVSAGYMQNEGIMIHTGFDRYSLRANSDFNIASWIDVGQSLGVTYSERKGTGGNGPINLAYRISPLLPVYDIQGNFAGTKSPGTSNAGNPVAELYRNRNDYARNTRVLASTYAQLNLLKGLSFRTLFGVDLSSTKTRNYDLANPEFTQTNFGNGLSEGESRMLQYNWANTVTYTTQIGTSHTLTVLAGTEAVKNTVESFSAGRSTFAFEDLDFMILGTGEANIVNDGDIDEWALFSYFGRLNYNYRDKYLLEAVVRRDGSSRFSKKNRWGTFPAFSVGWRILEDLGEVSFIDDLKLRVGWGKNGNDNVGNYNSYSTYRAAGSESYYNISGSSLNSSEAGFHQFLLGNPEGRWEASTSTNVGLDVSLLNYRLEANLDVYRRLTTDMLYPDSRSDTWGALEFPDVNIGEMKNTGFDLMLTYQSAEGADVDYAISANLTHYTNEVVKLNDDPDEFRYGRVLLNDPYTINRAGAPVSSLYGYIVEGIFNTPEEVAAHPKFSPNADGTDTYSKPGVFKFKDVNGDGVITPDDRTIIGNPHPDFTYGLNLDLRFRDSWDMTLFLQGSQGNDVMNHTRRELLFNRYDGNYLKERLYESWTPERYANGETITVPITTNSDGIMQRPSTFLLEDGSYLRLKNVQVGYSLPSRLLSRISVQRLRVYIQATNLFTITGYSGLEPELSTGNDRGIGVDSSVYPSSRTYTLGFDINF